MVAWVSGAGAAGAGPRRAGAVTGAVIALISQPLFVGQAAGDAPPRLITWPRLPCPRPARRPQPGPRDKTARASRARPRPATEPTSPPSRPPAQRPSAAARRSAP